VERTSRRVLIIGAAGRDFHDFNTRFRDDPTVEVVAFTATQIPFIDDRTYPASIAGERYPDGIPIHPEDELERLVAEFDVDEVVFAYSDVAHVDLMHIASRVLATGASFTLSGPRQIMLESSKPVVAVTAVRTGVGKSPTSRKVCALLREAGRSPVVIRHPMPYGDLAAQRVQLFRRRDDLVAADVTIEEREEYEHHLDAGTPVMAGVDYEAILRVAEDIGDVIVFDGGNNDLPLIRPDVHIVLVDPHRAGHETTYHPGEANLRMADAVIVTKVDTADPYAVAEVRASVHLANPRAMVVTAALTTSLDTDRSIAGTRVLVIEDGPTLTHGSMKYGAGVLAAQAAGAIVVDPRDVAVGSIRDTFERYDVGPLLPALGYSAGQLAELSKTIAAVDCDLVLVATPVDLTKLISIDKPTVRVGYDYEDVGSPTLRDVLVPVL